jgi:hypothetical protein
MWVLTHPLTHSLTHSLTYLVSVVIFHFSFYSAPFGRKPDCDTFTRRIGASHLWIFYHKYAISESEKQNLY